MVAWPWCYFGTEKKKKALNYQQGCELQPIFKEPYVNFYFLFFFFPQVFLRWDLPWGLSFNLGYSTSESMACSHFRAYDLTLLPGFAAFPAGCNILSPIWIFFYVGHHLCHHIFFYFYIIIRGLPPSTISTVLGFWLITPPSLLLPSQKLWILLALEWF